MAMSSKEWLWRLKSQKFGADTMFVWFGPLPNVSHTRTRLSGLGNGSALRSVAFITLKMVVLAPIPRASVRTAMLVNPGFFRSEERRVGKECRSRCGRQYEKKKGEDEL